MDIPAGSLRRVQSIATVFCVALATSLLLGSGPAKASEFVHETEHFLITFSSDVGDPDAPELLDANGNAIPDSVDRLGEALEAARRFVIDELGYRLPPGEPLYPVYIARAESEGYIRAAEGDSDSRASYIVIPPNLIRAASPDARVASLAVHEYFHAVQYGYDYDEDHWILEASSSWIEERLDDEANTPLFLLDDFVPFPERSLMSSDGDAEYGAFLFLEFLSERFDGGAPDVVRELWELMAASETFPGALDLSSTAALGSWLGGRGVSLAEAWNEFLLWRLQLSRFSEGASYRAALTEPWPSFSADIKTSGETCRIAAGEDRFGLSPLSGTYGRLKPQLEGGSEATLTVVGPAGTTAFASLKALNESAEVIPLVFDTAGVARATVPFTRASVRRLVVGIGNSSTTSSAPIAYSLIREGADSAAVHASVPRSVQFGLSTRLNGSVVCAGEPAPFAQVEIRETTVDGVSQILRATTDSEGVWSLPVSPEESSVYSVTLNDPLLSDASVAPATLGVVTSVIIDAPARAERVQPVEVSGLVTPVHPGAPMVFEYRRPARQAWLRGGTFELGPDGYYEQAFLPPGRGFWEVRIRMVSTGDDDHLPGTSLIETIEARP